MTERCRQTLRAFNQIATAVFTNSLGISARSAGRILQVCIDLVFFPLRRIIHKYYFTLTQRRHLTRLYTKAEGIKRLFDRQNNNRYLVLLCGFYHRKVNIFMFQTVGWMKKTLKGVTFDARRHFTINQ